MRRILIFLTLGIILSSCGVVATQQPLYNWGGSSSDGATVYEDVTYRNYKNQTPESICSLIVAYESMVKNPAGTRQVPPPGICAEYGYLLLQPSTAATFETSATAAQKSAFDGTDYASIFTQRGEEMLEKEIELYPESATFIKPLIKKLTE